MRRSFPPKWTSRIIFGLVFLVSLLVGAWWGTLPATAAPDTAPVAQTGSYAGPDSCRECHTVIADMWSQTRHAHAFSSPIFQRDWTGAGSEVQCLACHTTGFIPETGSYAYEGVTCESCHGQFNPNHPESPMGVKADENLCATCHKNTTDEWRASKHGETGITCQACHNPHTQTPKADSVTELCVNCHKEQEGSFTHGTHANAGLECSNCHMYTKPLTQSPIEGLVPTGHTFSVGSDTCIACHQDTVHSRDSIVKLTGEVQEATVVDASSLKKIVEEQKAEITSLEATSSVRLYTGLAQGAIIGLIMGAVSAWIVSQRIKVIEVE